MRTDSAFIPGLKKQCGEKAEENGSGDAACGGLQPSSHDAKQPVAVDGLAHTLCKVVAEAGQGDGRACAAELYNVFVQTESAERDARDDVGRQDPCGCQTRFVDQKLADQAQKPAGEKGFEIFQRLTFFRWRSIRRGRWQGWTRPARRRRAT